jgi:predicted transcriptional regulator
LRIAGDLGADVLAVFRRIATLPDRAEGLVLCDASGTITFRKPIPAFTPPRFGAACALWPLYAALARPMLPVEALAEMDGRANQRLRLRAYAQTRHVGGFQGVELRYAAMLVTPVPQTPTTIPVLAIGSTCRVCARPTCPARREPSILGA